MTWIYVIIFYDQTLPWHSESLKLNDCENHYSRENILANVVKKKFRIRLNKLRA